MIGAGLAGLLTVWRLQKFCQVTLICKGDIYDSNSALAQGGVAVAMSENELDSAKKHVDDTLQAGCNINDPEVVQAIISEGEAAISDLVNAGMCFDMSENGHFAYAMEGAQQVPRVLHADGDKTGQKLVEFAYSLISEDVKIIKHAFVSEILVNDEAYGVRYLDQNDVEYIVYADYTVLATGGLGSIYQVNANNLALTGDGYALAKRAGTTLRDMEFVQFHPTLLKGTRYLVSEAIRGAGGRLVDETGKYIMQDIHPLGDLAPRDIIAREISKQYSSGHQIFLDINQVSDFSTRFPALVQHLADSGIDARNGLIPVEPGAHFFMGGVATDLQGKTNIKRLYAVGEVASTGLHGANRLASNSLLECIVMSKRAANSIQDSNLAKMQIFPAGSPTYDLPNQVKIPSLNDLKSRISKALSIFRTRETLLSFINWTAQFDTFKVVANREVMQIENILLVARQIAGAAYKRTDSIGAHYIKTKESK